MAYWVIWIIAAAAFTIAELISLALYMAPCALGSIAALASGALGAPLWAQALVFATSSVLLIFTLRPLAKRHEAKPTLTGTAALVGTVGIVTADVSPAGGRAKVAGSEWSATSVETISVGTEVLIESINGASLVVRTFKTNKQGE